MSGLEARIRAEIERDGPMPLDRYMALALTDPVHGYYMDRDPLGAGGDFITAPEISQMFGELLGLWLADCWQRAGQPRDAILAELGPGRGTLMADALRAIGRAAPAMLEHAALWLVEASPALKAIQRDRLGGAGARWAGTVEDLPDGPLFLIANEFFDALPVRQVVRRGEGLAERAVGLTGGELAFVDAPLDRPLPYDTPELADGEVFELCEAGQETAVLIGRRISGRGGAALIVDYGHGVSAPGDTVQAMRNHAFHPVLSEPGIADLTAHVDFAVLSRAAAGEGAAVHGPIGQRQLLLRLGIEARLGQLMKNADPATADGLAAGFRRLTDPEFMGHLFKALAISPADQPTPAGFADEDAYSRNA